MSGFLEFHIARSNIGMRRKRNRDEVPNSYKKCQKRQRFLPLPFLFYHPLKFQSKRIFAIRFATCLIRLKLHLIQMRINSALRQKLFMCAFLRNSVFRQNQNPFCIPYRRQTVRNDERCPVFCQKLQ